MTTLTATATPAGFAGQLLPHQLDALVFLQARPRALCALATGMGKTATACGLAAWMLDTGQLHAESDSPAVVYLTDAPLLEQTAAEVRRFLPGVAAATTKETRYCDTKPSAKAVQALRERQGRAPLVVVGTYAWLLNRLESTAAAWRPALVILDEVTAVSGGGPMQRASRELAARAQRVLGLSATPYQSDPMQSFSVLETIGTPGLWARAQFASQFVTWSERYEVTPGCWVEPRPESFASPAHQEAFRAHLHALMYRVLPEETGQKLPELTRSYVWVPLHPLQRTAYEHAAARSGAPGAKAREVAGRHAGAVSSLVDELVAQLTGPYAGRQAVVFCESLEVLPLAAAALEKVGISSVTIEGKVPQTQREPAVRAFRDGHVQVLLGSRVLERGLNLQCANLLISLDSSWTEDREVQREGRIHRIGSLHEIAEHLVLLPDTPLSREKLHRVRLRGHVARSILSTRT
ncbi:helicase-related protein [Kineococcus glutinatus]|uniref:Helicase-like protein n=1 Tax=Kineococcus glutinatus TaxID=1070872 RepID=A0ABP9H2F9_9ACTN